MWAGCSFDRGRLTVRVNPKKLLIYAVVVSLLYGAFLGSAYLLTYYKAYDQLVTERIPAAAQPERPSQPETRDIQYHMRRLACEQTAAFVIEHMLKVPAFPDKYALFQKCLESVDPGRDGFYCEFGVGSGTTIKHLASKTKHTIHGFDSFEGLPEDWRTGYAKGTFAVGELPKVPEHVKLHKGWFNESLPVWAQKNPGPMAFMHMDADLYSSTRTIFEILGDRIVPGTVIQFDEYFNYPGWQGGEHKAFTEFVKARNVKFEYLGYVDVHEQVAVRIQSIGPLRAE
jgi:hypothetical protein